MQAGGRGNTSFVFSEGKKTKWKLLVVCVGGGELNRVLSAVIEIGQPEFYDTSCLSA